MQWTTGNNERKTMATAMKINKEKYLAKCQEALNAWLEIENRYQADLEKWEKDTETWGKKVIKSGQLKMSTNYSGDQFFYATGKLAEERPKKPKEELYYDSRMVYYKKQPAIDALREVIALIEMTDSDTIGVSVANKVSQYL